jgi:hypothetical protein
MNITYAIKDVENEEYYRGGQKWGPMEYAITVGDQGRAKSLKKLAKNMNPDISENVKIQKLVISEYG